MIDSNGSVLLTGAFGQVGTPVLQRLLEEGESVVALDVENSTTITASEKFKAEYGDSGKLSIRFVNLLNKTTVLQTVKDTVPRVIIHLAAIVSPPCYSNPALARRINVDGTRFLVEAAEQLSKPPLFVFASSSAVYGSRNHFLEPEIISSKTPVNPIDCYGVDKVMGESIIRESTLRFAILRLGGVISPAGMGNMKDEYLVLVRATPRDNRVHAVDARDAALAFINAARLEEAHQNQIYLIGGNDSYKKIQRELEDDVMESIGIGRLGNLASLPGDPSDPDGWSFTDWYDTKEAEAVLHFQKHDWQDTRDWIASSLSPGTKVIIRLLSPIIRIMILIGNWAQRRFEKRGRYAAPWKLIEQKYGPLAVEIEKE